MTVPQLGDIVFRSEDGFYTEMVIAVSTEIGVSLVRCETYEPHQVRRFYRVDYAGGHFATNDAQAAIMYYELMAD